MKNAIPASLILKIACEFSAGMSFVAKFGSMAVIGLIAETLEKGLSEGKNFTYSGTTQFTVVWPVPEGTSTFSNHGSTLFICCSSFHGGLITIMPEAVMPR